ncbi:MAG: transmembrane 220 family protein [Candidatus Eisenbacteria bacterium]
MIVALRILNGALAALFVYAAAVNFNDPDPVQWVAIYTAGAVATAWAAWHPGTLPWWAPLVVGAVAALWAATLAPRVLGKIRFGELWGGFEMKTTLIEEGREFYGLCITAGAMVLCALTHALAARR